MCLMCFQSHRKNAKEKESIEAILFNLEAFTVYNKKFCRIKLFRIVLRHILKTAGKDFVPKFILLPIRGNQA